MRSHDVAELAGVSVRTLRHYHQIGILPEPFRQANGYRSYDLATIARLLRIRQLTELGVPLDRVEVLLETTPDEGILDEIDSRLTAAIERLQGQRRQIARLRETGERADLPEGLAEILSLGPPSGTVGVLAELDQDTLLLVARVLGPDTLNRQALDDLAGVLQSMTDDADLGAAGAEFDQLPVDATSADIGRAAQRLATALAPIVVRLQDSPAGRAISRTSARRWPDPSQDSRLNPAQARAMTQLTELLDRDEPG
ncbi:MerR family transcriptional regulator [Aeromicrobium sp. CF3.5]|uniref:MerR family transcriptional regulator n=1 Tax=Aeromicrobium sp. CF3.5 TaxID=3373078 RepID=UPI003EE54E0D